MGCGTLKLDGIIKVYHAQDKVVVDFFKGKEERFVTRLSCTPSDGNFHWTPQLVTPSTNYFVETLLEACDMAKDIHNLN